MSVTVVRLGNCAHFMARCRGEFGNARVAGRRSFPAPDRDAPRRGEPARGPVPAGRRLARTRRSSGRLGAGVVRRASPCGTAVLVDQGRADALQEVRRPDDRAREGEFGVQTLAQRVLPARASRAWVISRLCGEAASREVSAAAAHGVPRWCRRFSISPSTGAPNAQSTSPRTFASPLPATGEQPARRFRTTSTGLPGLSARACATASRLSPATKCVASPVYRASAASSIIASRASMSSPSA